MSDPRTNPPSHNFPSFGAPCTRCGIVPRADGWPPPPCELTDAEKTLAAASAIADKPRDPVARTKPPTVLHLMTQRDQPYGSVRQCCERCGVMIVLGGITKGAVTDDPNVFDAPPDGYKRCDDDWR